MLGMYELDQFCVGNDLTEVLRELNITRSRRRCVVLQMFFLGLVHTYAGIFPFYLKAWEGKNDEMVPNAQTSMPAQ